MNKLWAKIRPVIVAQATRFIRLFTAAFLVTFLATLPALKGSADTKAEVALITGAIVAAGESSFRQWVAPVIAESETAAVLHLHLTKDQVAEIAEVAKQGLARALLHAIRPSHVPPVKPAAPSAAPSTDLGTDPDAASAP